MTYSFHIKPIYLSLIRKGIKKHEYRLNKPELGKLTVGDKIVLISNENENVFMELEVNEVKVFSTWKEALNETWQNDFSTCFDDLNSLLNEVNTFYKSNDVTNYGIIRIGIKL